MISNTMAMILLLLVGIMLGMIVMALIVIWRIDTNGAQDEKNREG